jgi:glycosyl transferase family 25
VGPQPVSPAPREIRMAPAPGQALPVYLINLDRDPERLAFMRRQLEVRGLGFTRLSASDGNDPAILRTSRRSALCSLSPGAVGCFESHIRAWEQLLASDAPACIVIEDDVVLSSDFMQSAMEAAASVDFDVIKLDVFARRVEVGARGVPLSSGRTLHRFLGRDWCTGGYVVSREGARRLLRKSKGYTRPVDNFMYDGRAIFVLTSRIYSLIPASCAQTGLVAGAAADVPQFESNIVDRNQLPKDPVRRALFRVVVALRLETGPLQRVIRARIMERFAREQGLAVVDNRFADMAPR